MTFASLIDKLKGRLNPKPVNSCVPRIIHRTLLWDADIPEGARAGYDAFHAANPSWEVRLWRNDEVRRLAADLGWLAIFDSYQTNIQRADFARYIILLAEGGCYADFDVSVRKRGFLDRATATISKQDRQAGVVIEACFPEIADYPQFRRLCPRAESRTHDLQPIRKGKPEVPLRVANYFFLASPGSEMIRRIISLVIERASLPVKLDYDVLYTTGPDVVSEVVFRDPEVAAFIDWRMLRHNCHSGWRKESRFK